jgi:hypothetical protein
MQYIAHYQAGSVKHRAAGYRRGVSEQQDAGSPATAGRTRTARVRRAPRYGVFLGTGAAVGVLVAVVSGLIGPVDAQSSRGQLIGYLAIGFGLIGGLLGGTAAVLVERFGRRSRIDHR